MEELHSFFYSRNVRNLTYQIGHEYFRDINLFFVFDENVPPPRTSQQKWYTTNVDFFNEAICAKAIDFRFNEANFAKNTITTIAKEIVLSATMIKDCVPVLKNI